MKRPRPLLVFLSYSTKDKRVAGQIKEELEQYGLDAFLAHDDIAPSRAWERTIIEKLNRCDVFMPLITNKNFHASFWTDQECGYAFSRGKVILPICTRKDPYGFLNGVQAHKRKPGHSLGEVVASALSGLSSHNQLRNRLRELLITSLRTSESYDQSIAVSKMLLTLSPFSKRQMNMIVKNSLSQGQVQGSTEAMKHIRQLIRRNHPRGDKSLLHRLTKNPSI